MDQLDAFNLDRAADWIGNADALLIGAGAGMGVDSGLPDFRGNEGFWRAYPKFRDLGLSFIDLANPRWFHDDPAQAWGFYGHRFNLYQQTQPHLGFEVLRRWGESKTYGAFVFTSNVDGHFQKAGFDDVDVIECHGSIRHLQCVDQCSSAIWPAPVDLVIDVDETQLRARGDLPSCPHCHGLARPNILMFGDWSWTPDRTDQQQQRYARWLQSLRGANLVVIEMGAGTAVPTVRYESESKSGQLIRINPRDAQVPRGAQALSLASGALAALTALDQRMMP